MLCNKSYFCRWFRVERGDLFLAFSPGVFVSFNTGFDLWCDSASGRPRRSNDEFVLEIVHLPLSEYRNIMSRLVCWVFQINELFLNQFSVQFLSRNGDGPDWSLNKLRCWTLSNFTSVRYYPFQRAKNSIIFTNVFDRTIRQNTSWLYSDTAKSDNIYRHHKAVYITSSGLSTVSTTYTSKWRSSQLTSGSTGARLALSFAEKKLKKTFGTRIHL